MPPWAHGCHHGKRSQRQQSWSARGVSLGRTPCEEARKPQQLLILWYIENYPRWRMIIATDVTLCKRVPSGLSIQHVTTWEACVSIKMGIFSCVHLQLRTHKDGAINASSVPAREEPYWLYPEMQLHYRCHLHRYTRVWLRKWECNKRGRQYGMSCVPVEAELQ
ncbi:hypothetical protein K503DRAFT_373040 [Rhizopogon vinicolor AM-OR11-026]|uniref:Uncharacterized protein n=1 Tax=Rhizopogon vinicolor AM-OR11-026 TaxID=1314800 RepID=A0A1B7MRW2_9AGAM|nr:hypothetical protein K503DRAFT_373040 [Rhizopogon vinicolor AM-OR11-026]